MGSNVTDLTQSFVDANGSRDLNSSNSQKLLAQLSSGGQYDPSSAYSKATQAWNQSPSDAYAKLQPANDAIASDASKYADSATEVYGKSMNDLAAQQSTSGRQAMEQRFAQGGTFGTDSGASRNALMQAAQSPYAQADAQVASKRSDVYSSYLNQGTQQAAQNYYSTGDRYASLGNNYLSALSGLSQQAYVAPQFQSQKSKGSNALSGAISGASAGIASGNVWGAAAGGVLGGIAGYLS